MDKAAFWDDRIAAWEASRYSWFSRFDPFSRTVRARMREAGRLVREDFKRHTHILDLGCGGGLLARAVSDDHKRRYTGVDFSRTAVSAARCRFSLQAGRIRFELKNVLEGPGWEAPLIVFLGLLDWLDEAEMRTLFGRLNGDSLCFSFTEADSGAAGLFYRRYRRVTDGIYRARDFSESQIVDAARSAGYRVDRVIRVSRLDPGRLVAASKLC
ncbi:MAG: class I SAM-dependent methyltransferase [Elusimicrobiales bacterium]|jgi:SAM-dependent methyltransferase